MKGQSKMFLNPNKAGLFKGYFFWGGGGSIWPSFPLHISRRTYLISTQLYAIVKLFTVCVESEKMKTSSVLN